MDLKIFDRMESEVRGYVRSFPVIFKQARGSVLIDEVNNEYIDFFSGAGTLNYGHNNPILKKRLIEYLNTDGLVHGLDMATCAKKHFLETVERVLLKPRNWQYTLQFTGPTGTNAVEAALKLARQVKGRQNVISFTHGFHGVTGGSLAVTANAKFRGAAGVGLANTTFMPFDGYLGTDVNTMAYLERMLDDPSSGLDHPAAVIVETVQGEGGVNVASKRWLKELERLCHQHDMLLIVDEVQTGFARTGRMFAIEHSGVTPDLITMAKSLAGGMPLSGVCGRAELMDAAPRGSLGGTYAGNPLAIAAALAVLDVIAEENLTARAATLGQRLRQALAGFAHPRIAEIRGLGAMVAAEFRHPDGRPDPDTAVRIQRRALERGLVLLTCGAYGNVIRFLFPLTIPDSLLDEGLAILKEAMA